VKEIGSITQRVKSSPLGTLLKLAILREVKAEQGFTGNFLYFILFILFFPFLTIY